jgi:hypothetical protein
MTVVFILEAAMPFFLPGEAPKFVGLEVTRAQVAKPRVHHPLAEFSSMKHDPDYGFLFDAYQPTSGPQ